MKQYVIDQLRESDYDHIHAFLDENAEKTAIEDVYRMDLPEELLTEIQKEHTECAPFYYAINLTRKQVSFELLIRTRHLIRCSCIAYASPEQRDHIIQFADNLLARLGIRL